MRKKDSGIPFYEKTQNMRPLHKNRQNSVEIITHILFDQGMDARQLKKAIQVFAMDKAISSSLDEIAIAVFDKNVDDITDAEERRFQRVANKMLDDAISKL